MEGAARWSLKVSASMTRKMMNAVPWQFFENSLAGGVLMGQGSNAGKHCLDSFGFDCGKG
jgi:hypothetical protein